MQKSFWFNVSEYQLNYTAQGPIPSTVGVNFFPPVAATFLLR